MKHDGCKDGLTGTDGIGMWKGEDDGEDGQRRIGRYDVQVHITDL